MRFFSLPLPSLLPSLLFPSPSILPSTPPCGTTNVTRDGLTPCREIGPPGCQLTPGPTGPASSPLSLWSCDVGQVLSNEVNFIMLILGVPIVHRIQLLLPTPHTSFGPTKKLVQTIQVCWGSTERPRAKVLPRVPLVVSQAGMQASVSGLKVFCLAAELQLTQWVNERRSTFLLIFLYWCSFNIFFSEYTFEFLELKD